MLDKYNICYHSVVWFDREIDGPKTILNVFYVSYKCHISLRIITSNIACTFKMEMRKVSIELWEDWFNSYPPISAYMVPWIGSAVVQFNISSARSHYINQCWVIVNWTLKNKLQWNFYQNKNVFFTEIHLKISLAKWRPFLVKGRWGKCFMLIEIWALDIISRNIYIYMDTGEIHQL